MKTKRCHSCNIEKSLECFPKDKSKQDGYGLCCRGCKKKQNHEYYLNNKKRIYCKYYKKNKEAILEKVHKYRLNNKAKILESARKYRLNNKKKILKTAYKYRLNNKEKISKRDSDYRLKNKKRILKRERKNWLKNKERKSESSHKYSSSEKGKLNQRQRAHRRRMLINSLKDTLSLEQWNKILKMQHTQCNICNKNFTKKRPATMDHIIPISLGGDLTFENVQALCHSCNSQKCAKLDTRFIQTWGI